MATERGQALVELALGLMLVALVLAAAFGVSQYVIASMNGQRTLRAEAGRHALGGTGGDGAMATATRHETITVSPLAADYIFGSTEVDIKEEVHLPLAGIQQQ